jgi:RND family efflux transporter MFP subunit
MDMRTAEKPGVGQRPPAAARSRLQIYAALLAAVVAVLAVAWWFYGRGIAVTVATVATGSAAEIVYATGAVEPDRWARVATLVPGRIVERCHCEGKTVRTGDLLARLDDSEPRVALQELYAREDFAIKELDRQRQLIERNATSTQAFERAQTELRQIQGAISVQRERLANYRLTAPIDGIVLREDGEVGEIVNSNTILYRIGWLRPLLLVAQVNEEDIPKVDVGQTVLLRSDAFAGQRLTGNVRDITPAGDPQVRTYRIRIALPDDTPLRVGMSVEANIVVREKDRALLVPASAVSQDAVYVVEGARAVRRPVRIGIRGTQAVEILSGAKEGERVVTPIPAELIDGTRVHVAGEAVGVRK